MSIGKFVIFESVDANDLKNVVWLHQGKMNLFLFAIADNIDFSNIQESFHNELRNRRYGCVGSSSAGWLNLSA